MLFNPFRKKKVGLALSGGGARGLAHIGVLKVFHDHRIPVDMIAGTSAGALIGSLFAGGVNITTMMEIATKVKWKNFFRIVLSKSGLVSSEEIENFVISQIGKKTFADMEKPFSAVTIDIKTGEEVVLDKGEVCKAVRASCSFPWMYIPFKYEKHLLVDGVLKNNLPSDIVRKMGADIVIGVDVIPRLEEADDFKNILEIFDRALDLFILNQDRDKKKGCDVLITPVHERISSLELDKAERLVQLGEEAAKKALPEIKKALSFF
ncbi:MAG: patatin-like phospholipase family protein [Candidatus Saganbacteria bacterium]|nr:patatin-like phospholipase family protein [Candidatus Saganbacteria bacterium]